MKAILLGCGTSSGVPRVGNDWGACDPEEPRNRRTRVSLYIGFDGKDTADEPVNILIDTSPDLRQQCLEYGVHDISHVLWTHDHADHCHGIDDLRPFVYRRNSEPIHGFARDYTADALRKRFGYVFDGELGYVTIANLNIIEESHGNQVISLPQAIEIAAIDQPHGPVLSTGFRITQRNKSVGYATDFSEVTDDMIAFYKGCDYLVTDCLRREPHPTHAHLDMALELAAAANVGSAVLTHLDKSMDYVTLCEEVGDRAIVGYDGLEMRL